MRVGIIGDIQDDRADIVIRNLGKLIYHSNMLIAKGHHPFCPAFIALQGIFVTSVDGSTAIQYRQYMEYSKDFLSVCECVLVTGFGRGSREETLHMQDLNIPIYYDITDIPPPEDKDA